MSFSPEKAGDRWSGWFTLGQHIAADHCQPPVQECNSRTAGRSIYQFSHSEAGLIPVRPGFAHGPKMEPSGRGLYHDWGGRDGLESGQQPFPAADMTASQSTPAQELISLWKLGGLSPWHLARNVVREIDRDDLLGSASGLAFNFLLALFPLMLFLLALFGLFASRSSQLENSLLSFCADFLPYDAYRLVGRVTDELAANTGGGKLAFGLVAGLGFASGGMSSLFSTLNVAYRVRETRSWFKVRAIALALTLTISILLLSALFMVLVGDRFVDWLQDGLQGASILLIVWKGLQWPAAALFVTASFSLIYYFGPNLERRRWHWITPGSVFGMILWLGASVGFRAYLHFFNTYSATYGSLGAVMILMVSLYVIGLAFLIGGAINAEIERAANEPISWPRL